MNAQKTTLPAQMTILHAKSRLLENLLRCLTNVTDDTPSSDILGAVSIAADLAGRLALGIDAATETAHQDLVRSIYEMDSDETMTLDETNTKLKAVCKELYEEIRQDELSSMTLKNV